MEKRILLLAITICTFGFALSSYAATMCPRTPQEAEAGGWVVTSGNIQDIKAIGFDHAMIEHPVHTEEAGVVVGKVHCSYGFLKRSKSVAIESSFTAKVENVIPSCPVHGWHELSSGTIYCGEWCDPTLTKCVQPKNCQFIETMG